MINQNANLALKEIRNHTGMEDFKQLAEEWYVVAQNLSNLPQQTCNILPNCLFSAKSGTGITRLLGLMAHFLEEMRLLEFIGDIKYFEFVLDRSENLESFPAFSRLIDITIAAAGFRGTFKGLACIDISEWVDHLQDRRFQRFLEYAADCNNDILFIFTVPPLATKKTAELEATLSSYLRLRHLTLDLPNIDALYMCIHKCLHKQGFSIDKQSASVLIETLAVARELPSFNGYKTLNLLVQDIIYEKTCHKLSKDKVITVKDVQRFLPDGQWIIQLTGHKNQHDKKIGFALGGK